MDKYKMGIEIMCARCINYEVCGGTGCQPKNDLKELISEIEATVSKMEKVTNNVTNKRPTSSKMETVQEDGGK